MQPQPLCFSYMEATILVCTIGPYRLHQYLKVAHYPASSARFFSLIMLKIVLFFLKYACQKNKKQKNLIKKKTKKQNKTKQNKFKIMYLLLTKYDVFFILSYTLALINRNCNCPSSRICKLFDAILLWKAGTGNDAIFRSGVPSPPDATDDAVLR